MKIERFTGQYRFLSNFYPCHIVFLGDFPSVEHAYQSAKTLNEMERREIAMAATPGEAKSLGRHVTLRENWDAEKIGVMNALLVQKFSHADLKEKLLATGDAELIEGNHWGDTYWGVCNGVGKNVLGRLLMDVRSDLRKENK